MINPISSIRTLEFELNMGYLSDEYKFILNHKNIKISLRKMFKNVLLIALLATMTLSLGNLKRAHLADEDW
jgi:hypothetical protein